MSDYRVEVAEARLALSWAAKVLNTTERLALEALMRDMTLEEAAAQSTVTRGGVWMAQQSALAKMRKRLARLKVTKTADLIRGPEFIGRRVHETRKKRSTGAE